MRRPALWLLAGFVALLAFVYERDRGQRRELAKLADEIRRARAEPIVVATPPSLVRTVEVHHDGPAAPAAAAPATPPAPAATPSAPSEAQRSAAEASRQLANEALARGRLTREDVRRVQTQLAEASPTDRHEVLRTLAVNINTDQLTLEPGVSLFP
jgi:3-oxoacyl-ACP reductase-like protein